MSGEYVPGPASATLQDSTGESWTFVLSRELRHPPARVWQALTDPEQLKQWAPFDADGNLGVAGQTVHLSTVGTSQTTESRVRRADYPHLLEFDWGGHEVRWELEDFNGGTRLTLWASINRQYVSMGAAGWHICLDVLVQFVDGDPIGRLVGPHLMKDERWQRLNSEYARLFKG
jgi:uncharacterized protein YndB with AHSA1/START domain